MIKNTSKRNDQTVENSQMNTRLIEIINWDIIFYSLSKMEHADHIPMNHVAQLKKEIIDELAATLESLGCDFSYATDLLLRLEQDRLVIENLHTENEEDQVQIPILEQSQLQNEIAVEALVFINHPGAKNIKFDFLGKKYRLNTLCFFCLKMSMSFSFDEFFLNEDIFDILFSSGETNFELNATFGKHGGQSFPLNLIRNSFTRTSVTVFRSKIKVITAFGGIKLNPVFTDPDPLMDYEEPRQAPPVPLPANRLISPILFTARPPSYEEPRQATPSHLPATQRLAPRLFIDRPPSRFVRFSRYVRSLFCCIFCLCRNH
jgi:hypothetical protein